MTERKYYVYEFIRLDTNEPFYIGKGSGTRWRDLRRRNRWCDFIIKKVPIVVCVVKDNLTEQEAFEYECGYIWYYRDILGYSLTNQTDGGDGASISGENHHMYGKKGKLCPRFGKKYPEAAEKLKGKNNPKARECQILKNGKVIKEFDTKEFLYQYIKNNYGKPNSSKTIEKCFETRRVLHGLQFKYK